MRSRQVRRYAANGISLFRLGFSVAFATLAFQPMSPITLALLYGLAAVSDTLDGVVARRFESESYFGKIVDLVSDKSLTVVSILFAAARGVALPALAVIGVRDIVMMGMRLLSPEGVPVLGTSRLFGGIMAVVVWGNTCALILRGNDLSWFAGVQIVYGVAAIIFLLNLVWRIGRNRDRLKALLDLSGGLDQGSQSP